MNRPAPKGWCPDAYHPMEAADGFILRVKPRFGRLSPPQLIALAQIAERFGNGEVQITQRGNLQLRGVAKGWIAKAQTALQAASLIDDDPASEHRRNTIFAPAPLSKAQEETVQLFYDRLGDLPELPSKFCFGFDFAQNQEHAPTLGAQADIMIRQTGKNAIEEAIAQAHWFVHHAPADVTRLRKLPPEVLPEKDVEIPQSTASYPLGHQGQYFWAKAPFGVLPCPLIHSLACTGDVGFATGGVISLTGAPEGCVEDLILSPDDPRALTRACIGAPHCSAARGPTREIAARLGGDLHVSGCPKGCADPNKARRVLLPKGESFDLVLEGFAWDEPQITGLSLDQIIEEGEA